MKYKSDDSFRSNLFCFLILQKSRKRYWIVPFRHEKGKEDMDRTFLLLLTIGVAFVSAQTEEQPKQREDCITAYERVNFGGTSFRLVRNPGSTHSHPVLRRRKVYCWSISGSAAMAFHRTSSPIAFVRSRLTVTPVGF